MKPKRDSFIDNLRGIATLLMVLIHTNWYFMRDPFAKSLLNFSQFAVPAFVFCSAFILTQKSAVVFSWKTYVSYVLKRIARLLGPYYIYLVCSLVLLRLYEPWIITPSYVFHKVFLWGGVDYDWLVVLFLQLAILLPLINHLWQRRTGAFVLFCLASLASSIVFLFFTPLAWFRPVMWLPWSLVAVAAFFFHAYARSTFFVRRTLLYSALVFGLSHWLLTTIGHTHFFQSNKYPPNLYYFSFSLMIILVVYQLNLFIPTHIRRFVDPVLSFFSRHSYAVFFVHLLVIYVFTKVLRFSFGSWGEMFVAVLLGTTISIWLITRGRGILSSLNII